MRSDMFKVIVERPRHGAGWARPGRPVPFELAPRQEPIVPRKRSKGLNENLKPLERFLESCVGRPWDKVYSELSENLSVRNAVQQHVRDHLRGLVILKVEERDDGVLRGHGWHWPVTIMHGDLYVDPRTGLLRRCRERRVPREVPARELIEIDPHTQWRLIDGHWFEIGFIPFPQRGEAYDVLARRMLKWDIAEHRIRGQRMLAQRKRQLGKRELREVARLLEAEHHPRKH